MKSRMKTFIFVATLIFLASLETYAQAVDPEPQDAENDYATEAVVQLNTLVRALMHLSRPSELEEARKALRELYFHPSLADDLETKARIREELAELDARIHEARYSRSAATVRAILD